MANQQVKSLINYYLQEQKSWFGKAVSFPLGRYAYRIKY